MNRLVAVLALHGFISALPFGHHQKPRVIHGTGASQGQFPYVAALNDINDYAFCNGIIIDTQWILTSADCIDILYDSDYIMVGSVTNDHTGTNFSISQVIMHEEFDIASLKNDVALIQIDGELTYNDNIQAIEIGGVGENVTCTVMGWGSTVDEMYPIVLQYAQEMIIDVETCKSLANDDSFYLGEETICGSGIDSAALCWGDSGGPLVCDGVLAGIASYSLADCGDLPDIFMRAASYKDWIDSKISGARK